MKTLYIDCFNGISGDMMIGALIDAGADPQKLQTELKKLNFDDEYRLHWHKVNKNGITATKFDVLLGGDGGKGDGGDGDGAEQDRKNSDYAHTHTHDHSHHDGHHHDHHHDNHHHPHQHRHYSQIVDMIEKSNLDDRVKDISQQIFRKIAEAEGKIHGLPIEKVHFHEVGAVDSIVDIVGAAILIDSLEISTVISAPVPVGSGTIQIDHGVYPVPAPATLDMLRGIPIAKSELQAEVTTPTGAAIIAALAEDFGPLHEMTIESIGYGAGTKTFPQHPNVLRVVIGHN